MGKPARGFGRADRLRRPEEFERVAQRGRRVAVGSFVLLAAPAEIEGSSGRARLGITVSRRVGKAVVRNRVKRWIREWFRHERGLRRANLDIVVVARRGAARATQRETARALKEGVRAAGVGV